MEKTSYDAGFFLIQELKLLSRKKQLSQNIDYNLESPNILTKLT
jgi:hypothetical protein